MWQIASPQTLSYNWFCLLSRESKKSVFFFYKLISKVFLLWTWQLGLNIIEWLVRFVIMCQSFVKLIWRTTDTWNIEKKTLSCIVFFCFIHILDEFAGKKSLKNKENVTKYDEWLQNWQIILWCSTLTVKFKGEKLKSRGS